VAIDVPIVGGGALAFAGILALGLTIGARRFAPRFARTIPLVVTPLVLVAILGSIFASVPAAAADDEPHRLGRLDVKALYGSFGRIETNGTISVPGDRGDSLEFSIDQRAEWELKVSCDDAVRPFVRIGVEQLTAGGWVEVRDSTSPDVTPWVGSCGDWFRRTWTSSEGRVACYRVLVGFGRDVSLRTVFAPYDVLLQGSLVSTMPAYSTGSPIGGAGVDCPPAG